MRITTIQLELIGFDMMLFQAGLGNAKRGTQAENVPVEMTELDQLEIKLKEIDAQFTPESFPVDKVVGIISLTQRELAIIKSHIDSMCSHMNEGDVEVMSGVPLEKVVEIRTDLDRLIVSMQSALS